MGLERAPDDFDISDVPDSVEVVDVQTRAESAIEASVRAYQEELERHLLGAWMAGYEAVDVVSAPTMPAHAGEDFNDPAVPALTAQVKVWDEHPGDDCLPYDRCKRVERYDLRPVTAEQVDELRGDY